MRRILFVLPMLGLGACYKYVPMEGAPVVGTEVRAHLSPDGAAKLGPTLGRGVTILDGRLLAEESGAWRMAVSQTRTGDDRVVSWTGEPVAVPRDAVARMQLRALDRPRTIRTAVLAAVGGIAVGLIIKGIGGSASGNTGGGGPPPP